MTHAQIAASRLLPHAPGYILFLMAGVVYPILLLPLLLSLLPDAREPAQNPELTPSPPEVEATLISLGEIDTRLTVPVALGSKGPYNFIIDTGAERTVVSRELARSLGLTPGGPVMLTSMAGTSQVDTVIVPQLSIPSVSGSHKVVAPKLDARNLGAVGLLGIDTLQAHQVSIDFEKGIMAVRPSEKRKRRTHHRSGEIVVTAKSLFGQLIVTDAYYGDTRIQVVIDTGAQVSMGNSELRRRLGRRRGQPVELTSVTGGKIQADYMLVNAIQIGDMRFDSMPVAFADVTPFARFGLTKRPALLLGMDALRGFRQVHIDFPNRQVRFLIPGVRGIPVSTGSMIPGVRGISPSTRRY